MRQEEIRRYSLREIRSRPSIVSTARAMSTPGYFDALKTSRSQSSPACCEAKAAVCSRISSILLSTIFPMLPLVQAKKLPDKYAKVWILFHIVYIVCTLQFCLSIAIRTVYLYFHNPFLIIQFIFILANFFFIPNIR